jgi:hypothetical protein
LKVCNNRNIHGSRRKAVTAGCRSYVSDVARDVADRATAHYRQAGVRVFLLVLVN